MLQIHVDSMIQFKRLSNRLSYYVHAGKARCTRDINVGIATDIIQHEMEQHEDTFCMLRFCVLS